MRLSLTVWVYLLFACFAPAHLSAATWDPAAAGYAGHSGKTIYVSKQGDNSDGTTWQKAFHTIQVALLAVPDDQGGHRIVVRPDSYSEANLYPGFAGAAGSYNLLIGDVDGRLGSGATGRIVIDSGVPEKGFKSSDHWRTIRAGDPSTRQGDPALSRITWDRWILRDLYATGGDAGLFWDLADKHGQFTVMVEDCVGIGRAYGGGFAGLVVRETEPIVFRRCYFMCLDWSGGAGALGVAAQNRSLPDRPDAICEDCTFVSADNAVRVLRAPGQYTRVKFKDCRLIVLNFSPPHGECSTGVICSDATDSQGGYLHADLEDSTLIGCRLFGTAAAGKERITYTTKGTVSAYVQYRQPVPAGFQRLGLLPTDVLSRLAPGNEKRTRTDAVPVRRSVAVPVPGDPSGPVYAGRKGVTLYVSKHGDNSDGSSWGKAFHTIQAALLAVPDAQGGHRVVIRPDTYVEANLYPSHTGAAGAYNLLVGDRDGRLGSGAQGWVVIDGSCPGVAVRATTPWGTGAGFEIVESKEPETGLKSCDWWCVLRSDNQFSGVAWDRWIYRNLYVTGSEGGIGWDIGNTKKGAEFSAVVEDCVGIGRFAGAYVAAHTPRKDEPVLFRRSYFMNLDRWVDDGGVYIRGESRDSMPDWPHAAFEDCTIVGPATALRMNQATGVFYHRVNFKDCRLIALNFSQPRLPHPFPVAILRCDVAADKLNLDFEDCALMGYTLGNPGTLTTRGKVQVYTQFEQPVPEGFERLGLWPVDLFDFVAPPKVGMR